MGAMERSRQTPTDNLTHSMPGRTVASDQKTLQRLRQSCRITLERYVDVASLNSGHLSRIAPFSLDDIGRANLTILRRKEDKAHQVYLDARDALLEYIFGERECGAED
jgi:hypothetical protein